MATPTCCENALTARPARNDSTFSRLEVLIPGRGHLAALEQSVDYATLGPSGMFAHRRDPPR